MVVISLCCEYSLFLPFFAFFSQSPHPTATLSFNGRGAAAASGVMAMAGDDDIISIGGSNLEMALFASFFPTTLLLLHLSLGEASKIPGSRRKSPGRRQEVLSQLLPDS